MASVSVSNLTHRFDGVEVLTNVNLQINPGEFISLLGPSGCGKTTLLRALGGFVEPSEGRIEIDGVDYTSAPPNQRPVNTVFQKSNLFPHLDVGENVAFGLRVAKVGKAERETRVRDALALVRLEGFERRRVTELSGGQEQRVNLARAVVNRPKVLLLDEPLESLDSKVRLELEAELRRVHREVGSTFVYVTHDQREALALSDRIAVLNRGQIEQIGPAEAIFRDPQSHFAARFVGDANVVPVEIADSDGSTITTTGDLRIAVDAPDATPGPFWLVVKPADVRFGSLGDRDAGPRGVVIDAAYRGSSFTYRVDCPALGATIKAEIPDDRPAVAVGSEVGLTWSPGRVRLLPREREDTPATSTTMG